MSQKAQYTPGPWRVRTDFDSYIRIDAGGEITKGPRKGDPDYDKKGQTLISEDFYLSDSSMKEITKAGRRELMANFTLAAAAPELLEAIEVFPDLHDGRVGPEQLLEACRDWYWKHAKPATVKATSKELAA